MLCWVDNEIRGSVIGSRCSLALRVQRSVTTSAADQEGGTGQSPTFSPPRARTFRTRTPRSGGARSRRRGASRQDMEGPSSRFHTGLDAPSTKKVKPDLYLERVGRPDPGGDGALRRYQNCATRAVARYRRKRGGYRRHGECCPSRAYAIRKR